ncbi:MAG TPA: metal ABC transporter ATP-binding protein [Aquifex aeolicus]|uniref:Metal ABC transporter ATP-binding protein n=1 Tax=Aquifex aeolicus TaxID=63363 RepID=A0A7C5L7G6_AQUAO|nr:metal ABC transporter ATP-binding protein [Aquifex aeolicus]
MQVIEIENLSFSYDGRTDVLEDLSLTVRRGEFVGIVGPNGAGKTTLFRIILGFLKPRRGSLKLFGENVETFRRWDRIGYVPQRLSVERNFPATVRELLDLTGEDPQEVIALLHLNDLLDRQFLRLSGGQQQIVLLGMALVRNPDLLLLDEPTAGLDVHFQRHIIQTLRSLSVRENRTILMISHDIGLVLRTVDRVLCLNRRIRYYGEPEGAIEAVEEMFGIKGVRDGAS